MNVFQSEGIAIAGVPDGVENVLAREENPWVADYVLLNLSIWWVQVTNGDSANFAVEVTETFQSLSHDLQ